MSRGFKTVSSEPRELRTSFQAEYDSVKTGTGLVDLVNSSHPTASTIIDDAIRAGFIPADAGPALQVGGQAQDNFGLGHRDAAAASREGGP